MKIAAVGDIHYTRKSHGKLRSMFLEATRSADVLLLCGDLTDYGLPEEAEVLAHDLEAAELPILAVFGNHDVEGGQPDAVREILHHAGVRVLDGDTAVIGQVGFAGVKGFCGGFSRYALEPWGEPVLKAFVREAELEAEKLDRALASLDTAQRIVVTHYAPIRETAVGEATEIFPFLGSSHLEEPINRHGVTVAFHGHCHRGSPQGNTTGDVPVYNVALPLLRKAAPDGPGFRLLNVVESAPAG